MSDIKLDPITNDINIFNDTISLIDNQQELTRQNISIYLRTFRGEMFWSILSGIPYLRNDNNPDQILGKVSKNFADIAIKEGIVSRDGVVRLVDYTSTINPNERILTVSFQVEIESGEIISIEDFQISV